MGKISTKSLLLGIGIGMMLSSLLNIYIYNKQSIFKEDKGPPSMAFTNETDLIESRISEIKENLLSKDRRLKEVDHAKTTDAQVKTKNTTEERIKIDIEKGMSSIEIGKILWEAELISFPEEFIERVENQGVARRLQAGSKEIPIGSTIDEIITILLEIN